MVARYIRGAVRNNLKHFSCESTIAPMPPETLHPTDTTAPHKQRRYVAILFADLCDSMTMASELDAEDVAETLDRYRQVCRAAVEHHQGIVARVQGDGVLAVFGYPLPAEDAIRRALETAEDLRSRVPAIPSRWSRPLQVHSGVHAGLGEPGGIRLALFAQRIVFCGDQQAGRQCAQIDGLQR